MREVKRSPNRGWRLGALALIAATAAGCGGEDASPAGAASLAAIGNAPTGVMPTTTQDSAASSSPAQPAQGAAAAGAPTQSAPVLPVTTASTPTAPAAPSMQTNHSPVITGGPSTSASSGSAYSFNPVASDPDKDVLGFSVTGKPSWATFSTKTGALTGTAASGVYPNIVISVTDGTASTSLPPFTIDVQPAPRVDEALLSWNASGVNTDGSELKNIAGYRVYHGTRADNLDQVVDVAGAASTSYRFISLSSGPHYFAVATYNATGSQGPLSPMGSKIIP